MDLKSLQRKSTIIILSLDRLSSHRIETIIFSEVRLFEDKGYGFLKFQTHLAATQAICEMTGQMLNGCQVSYII